MKSLVAILFCFGLPLLAGGLGGIASANAPEFYRSLDRPAWAPPSWLFGPVWTALYLMMGIAAFLVWREGGWSAPLWLFAILVIAFGRVATVAALLLLPYWAWVSYAAALNFVLWRNNPQAL